MTRFLVVVKFFKAVAVWTLSPSANGLAFFVVDLVDGVSIGAIPVEAVLIPA